jgi:hypothetical protein
MRYRLSSLILVCVSALAALQGEAQRARIIASAQASPEARGEVLKEMVDPCLGLRWQWVADPAHPDWPYHLILAGGSSASSSAAPHASASPRVPVQSFVIRAGDLITVHQQTDTVNARLQALALDSAAPGRSLRARLIVNGDRSLGVNSLLGSSGPIITVTASASGEAVWSIVRQTIAAGGSRR